MKIYKMKFKKSTLIEEKNESRKLTNIGLYVLMKMLFCSFSI